MTLDGTNTWLIAEPGSPSVVVVDPGPDDEGHLRRVLAAAAAGDRRVARILLTHGHPDHSPGGARVARRAAGPLRAGGPGAPPGRPRAPGCPELRCGRPTRPASWEPKGSRTATWSRRPAASCGWSRPRAI